MSRRGGGRRPSAHERALWDKVVADATPLPKRAPAPKILKRPEPHQPLNTQSTPSTIKAFELTSKPRGSTTGFHRAPDIAATFEADGIRMDRKTHSRMKRGKLKPEARIDLHGMTVSDAYTRLTEFMHRAAADGRRLVLVITGKGKERDQPGPMPVRAGILRHEVPRWLTTPPLSHIVLQVVPAHRRHGGSGAYYVYLRRTR